MARVHLFEFEDLPWFPSALRDAMTSYLAETYRITPFPKLWADRVEAAIGTAGINEGVDLASGASGPVRLVIEELERRGHSLRFTLTDLYPNPGALHGSGSNGKLRYWPKPVDAASVPRELAGIRTMFSAFHHFRPRQARAILESAFRDRAPICIFEATARHPAAIASTIVIPILVLLLTPRVRPFTLFRLVFTYLIPILPVLIFWDGFVSQLRTYSVKELEGLTEGLTAEDYAWTASGIRAPGLPAAVPCLIGRPVSTRDAAA